MNRTLLEIQDDKIKLQDKLAAALNPLEKLQNHCKGISIYGTTMTETAEVVKNLTRISGITDKALEKIHAE